MKILIITLLVFSMLLLSVSSEISDYDFWKLYTNKDYSETNKLGVIFGITKGRDLLKYTKQYKNISYHLSAPGVTQEDMMKTIDKVYSKPANRSIPMALAYWLAKIKLRDDDSNDYKNLEIQFRTGKALPHFGKLKRVIDGDTIEIDDFNGGTYRIRLVGIDAPEMKTKEGKDNPAGIKAKKHITKLLKGNIKIKTVLVKLYYYKDLYDKYGRVFAEIVSGPTPIAKNINWHMILDGHAKPYFYQDKKRAPDFKEDYESLYSNAYL